VLYGNVVSHPLPPLAVTLRPGGLTAPHNFVVTHQPTTTSSPVKDFATKDETATVSRDVMGVRRSVNSIIQELAAREKLKVILGPTDDKTLTVRLGAIHADSAIKGMAALSGLEVRRQGKVYYVATPEWLARAFPSRQYTEVTQTLPDQAKDWETVLKKILSFTAQVEAVGDNRLVIKASLSDLIVASSLLTQTSQMAKEPKALSASLALDVPLGSDTSLFQTIKNDGIHIEPGEKTTTFVLHGEPSKVVGGLRAYIAAMEKSSFPTASSLNNDMRN
jgi:hypothetical protein